MTDTSPRSELGPSGLWRAAMVVYGVLVLAFGLGALILPMLATLTATLVFGGLLTASGVVGLVALFFDLRARGFFWRLSWAVIATLGGLCIVVHPWGGALALTLVLGATLVLQGIISLVHALAHRDSHGSSWGWMAAGGLVTAILGGLLIWALPHAGMVFPGLFVAISLIWFGMTLIGLGFARRRRGL